ncbi:hypothetical protein MRS44_011977 [Fusarium solani]|uniref:uncharacterized protein n=1 Tax=Fusarium solani TaxID=169388 RepID=UPI0032C4600C|nr:hypothetical protein MRS44_011977 [Fusarium solani]
MPPASDDPISIPLRPIREADLITPPDVTAASLRSALTDLVELVGQENVDIVHPERLMKDSETSYWNAPKDHDMFYVVDKGDFVPCAVVRPGNVDEVSKIVKLANRYLVPLWPISRGRNLGYGGAAPRVRGSLVVDLGGRMNKIIEVDGKNACALVEPGVTFGALYEHLQQNDLKHLWVDVPDLSGGSIIGNTLDRGVGYTPYGEHLTFHCGMEVVLPNGEVIRTGMGSLPGTNTWQLFQYGFGPYHDGMFTQSNFGIVTKMGLWLMPDPGGYQSYLFTFEREEDLPKIVETMAPLRLANIINNAPSIRNTLLDAAVIKSKKEWTDSDAVLEGEDLDKIAKDLGIGRWNFYGALYGPKEARDIQWKAIKEAFMKIPGAKYYFPEDVPKDAVLHMRHDTLRGIPNTYELGWLNWLSKTPGYFGFSPISPATGHDAVQQYDMVKKRFDEFGFDYLGTFVVGWRELHHIVCIVYDKTDPVRRQKARKCVDLLVEDAAKLVRALSLLIASHLDTWVDKMDVPLPLFLAEKTWADHI